MRQVYVVTKMENGSIFVMQQKHLEHKGSKEHASLEVINPKNINVKEGSKVFIGLPQKSEAIRGIVSLFIPLCLCAVTLFCSKFLASLFKCELTEGFKFICIVIVFVLSSTTLAFFLRNTETIVKLQILSSAEK